MSSSFPQQSRRHFPKHLSAYLCFEKVARLRPRAYFIRGTHKIFLNDKRTPLFSRTCEHVFYYCIFIMLLWSSVCAKEWLRCVVWEARLWILVSSFSRLGCLLYSFWDNFFMLWNYHDLIYRLFFGLYYILEWEILICLENKAKERSQEYTY